MICDLHTHSVFSDGTYTPKMLIDEAIGRGISAIALTDHNTVDGLPDFISAAEGKNIDIALGSEFSVDYNGTELHLLGLFIKPEHFDEVSALMKDVMALKEQSNINLVNALVSAGFDLDYDEIKAMTPNGKINRAHVATAMINKGYVSSVSEAFGTYLSKNGIYYVEPKRIDVFEMLDFISSIGVVSVLAHPFLNLSEKALIEFLPKAKACGLVGMECYYSLYNKRATEISLQMADEFGILKSGGSDFHGSRKPDISLGSGKGNLAVPYECYIALKERAK